MNIITDERCTTYRAPGHPERPERISRTVEKLKQQSAIKIKWSVPAQIEDSWVLRAHTKDHVARLTAPDDFDVDTPFFPKIDSLARTSVGGAVAAMEFARRNEFALSLLRPPGHHATRNQAMGFCYLNSVAIAVLQALATGVKRVAVYDFDVHHGNGTEAILLNHPGVSFYSIHQYPCYPGTGSRNVGDNCYNFPVPPHTPRLEYRQILQGALQHLGDSKPELIAVSAGFDAYARDPLAQETLEHEDFQWLGRSFRKLGIPVFSVLEGGYSEDLPELILAYLQGLEQG
jgi:acetoin utilization deacetylase AcuC-like enzyme